MKDKLRPLERIDALTQEQRQQLVDWLLTGTLDQAVERVKTDFGADIPRSTMNRFRKRCELADYLDSPEESPTARAELINAAASGRTNFSQATVQLLEKQAFELAHATRDDGNLGALKDLFTLINGHKNTAIRDRLATVQEQKAKLREAELELKKSLAARQPDQSQIESDDLGLFAANFKEIERRAEAKFQLPSSVAAPCESVVGGTSSTSPTIEVGNPTAASPAPSAALGVQCKMETAHCSLLNEKSVSSVSSVPAVNSVVKEKSLEQRVNDYTVARYHEFIEKRDARKVGTWASFTFKTSLHACPCGNPVPCPEHGDYPKLFWQVCSDSAEYMQCLAARKLPYTAPRLIMIEQEKAARRSGLPAPDFSNTAAHALARWYSHTPRPRGTPPPDETWTTECPCGKKRPCDHHDPLGSEVRYLKPWNPDYIAALKGEGVPVHTPTPEQIEDMKKGIPPSSVSLTPAIHPGAPGASEPKQEVAAASAASEIPNRK